MNEVGDGAARGHAAAYSAAENKTTYQESFHPGQMPIPSIIRCLSLCEKSISTQPSPPLAGSRERQSGGQKTPEVLFMPIVAPRVSPGRERGMVPQGGPGWPGGPISQPKHKSPQREDQSHKQCRKGRRFQRGKERKVPNREGEGERHLGFGFGEGMGPWGGEGSRNQDLTGPSSQASVTAGGERAGMRKWQKNASCRQPFPARSPPVTVRESEGAREAHLAACHLLPGGRAPEPPKLPLLNPSGAEVSDASQWL